MKKPLSEPYETIRKRQTAKALAEVEHIRGIQPVALDLVKSTIQKRIEWALRDAEAGNGD